MTTAHDLLPLGPALAGLPETLDRVRSELIALQQAEAWLAARRAALLETAAVIEAIETPSHRPQQGDVFSRAATELAPALRMYPNTLEGQITKAFDLVEYHPQLFDALAAGEISQAHIERIRRASAAIDVADISAEQWERIDARIVDVARTHTPADTGRAAERIINEVHPRSLAQRHHDANQLRTVQLIKLSDGMAQLRITAADVLCTGVLGRINAMADAVQDDADPATKTPAPGAAGGDDDAADTRTRDQIRTDIALDLLLTSAPGALSNENAGLTANISVTIPADLIVRDADLFTDLLGAAAGGTANGNGAVVDEGFEALLVGTVNGYVPAVLARGLAGCSSSWTRLFESPETGSMLAVDAYRPTEAMKRLIRARDEHCRFPGCRVPARHCEIDHSLAWADGGSTTHDNLALLCKKHHRLKHASGWKIEHREGGTLLWTSPLGHRYSTAPETAVGFVEVSGARDGTTDPPPGERADPPGETAHSPGESADPPGETAHSPGESADPPGDAPHPPDNDPEAVPF